jgi:hypothetical protein
VTIEEQWAPDVKRMWIDNKQAVMVGLMAELGPR